MDRKDRIDSVPSGLGGGSGNAKLTYSPPMSPITMAQGDEVIISHPPVVSGIKRTVGVWQQVSETGLVTVPADFDLADASDYTFEDASSVLLNGTIALKQTGDPVLNSLQMDFRDAYFPTAGTNPQADWVMFASATENLTNPGSAIGYPAAIGAGHYYSRAGADVNTYIQFTLPTDMPAGTYAMHIYGMTYFVANGVAWVAFKINGGATVQKPNAQESWYNSGVRKWWPLGEYTFSPGDTIRFHRPDNQGADMGGVNFGSLKLTPVGVTPVNTTTGQQGTLKDYTSAAYPTQPKYVITPALDVQAKRILKINSFTHDAAIPANTEINALVSFDDGVTWKYYSSGWQTASEGTNRLKLNAHVYPLSTVLGWLSDFTCAGTEKIKIMLDLHTTNNLSTPVLSTLTVNFDHKINYVQDFGTDYSVQIFDQYSVVVTKVSMGSKLTFIEVEI